MLPQKSEICEFENCAPGVFSPKPCPKRTTHEEGQLVVGRLVRAFAERGHLRKLLRETLRVPVASVLGKGCERSCVGPYNFYPTRAQD